MSALDLYNYKNFLHKGYLMDASIVSKRVTLTDGMQEHIKAVTQQFEKYNLDIIAIKTIIGEAKNHKKLGIEVEFTIVLPRKDTIVIKQTDKDFYAACDIASERVKKVLRRIHDKQTSAKTNVQIDIEVPDLYSDNEEDEIVPTELTLHKPIEPQEALEELKTTNAIFKVFKDIDGNTRVLYRRKDGKFGLY